MGLSTDYPTVPEWVAKPEGYTDAVARYKGNIFRTDFWGSEPGAGDPLSNGWRLFDELYDQTPHTPTEKPKIIAYIPTWRTKEGFNYGNGEMYQYITHGIISFLTFSETDLGEFTPTSVTDVTAILRDVLVASSPYGTRIMIAVGGADDYGFLNLMTAVGNDPATPHLDQAVHNVVNFVTANSLDGVDLDLECWWGKPGEQDQGGRMKSAGPHPAGRGLTLFAQKLREAMPGKIVSATTFGTSWYGNNYDPALVNYVDWLGVMTYDLTGSWDQTPVGPHTALQKLRRQATSTTRPADAYQESYVAEQQGDWPNSRATDQPLPPGQDSIDNNPILSVEDSLWYWTNPFFSNHQGAGQGLPRAKIAAGIPVYGYDFAAAKDPDDLTGQVPPGYRTLRYKDILAAFPDAHHAPNASIKVPGTTPRPPLAHPLPPGDYPYAHNIYFETPDTAVAKLNFLKNVGAQGVIIWELSNDVWEDGKSIIKALYRASGNVPALPIERPGVVTVASAALWDSTGYLGFQSGWAGLFPGLLGRQFKDDGLKPWGARQFSARLWDIPSGQDYWKFAAEHAPAVIRRQYFNRPTRIVHLGDQGLWGEFDVIEPASGPEWAWSNMATLDLLKNALVVGTGIPAGHTRFLARLWGLTLSDDWKAAAASTPALIRGHYFDRPTIILDQGPDGLWGVFDVPNVISFLPLPMVPVQGANGYCCCMCNNTVGIPRSNLAVISLNSRMAVASGTPYLYAVLTTGDDSVVDVPAGVVMTMVAPDGTRYDHDLQSDSALVVMAGASVRCFIVKNPTPGDWTMTMTMPPGTSGFRCECGTVPSQDVYRTISQAHASAPTTLQPRALADIDFGPWMGPAAVGIIAAATVGAIAGIITAGFYALVVGLRLDNAETGLALLEANKGEPTFDFASDLYYGGKSNSMPPTGDILLMDASAEREDTKIEATRVVYLRRKRKLYPYVTASRFKDNQTTLLDDQMTRENVRTNLLRPSVVYCSAAGHGLAHALYGRLVGDQFEPVLERDRYDPAEVQGKIFHLYACLCGSASSVGLGADLVRRGARAFFGYSDKFRLIPEHAVLFCAPDMEVDRALIGGATADDAYDRAMAAFDKGIARLKHDGSAEDVDSLVYDKSIFVGPKTDPRYGDGSARL